MKSGEHHGLDEAKTHAKQACYEEEIRDKRYFVDIALQFGAKAIMPYTDKRLAYLSEVPSSVINPSTKSFVKDALRRRYGLGDIVERHRMSMQAGMGLRDPLRQALLQRYATYGKWINRIVRRLSS